MTLSLFGPDEPWSRLGDDRPILDGSHPANLYVSTLGAQALLATGNSCCYDTNFQIGYPRTPIINGSRVGEIFLLAAGATYQPAAYKIGLAVVSLLVPIFSRGGTDSLIFPFGYRSGFAGVVGRALSRGPESGRL